MTTTSERYGAFTDQPQLLLPDRPWRATRGSASWLERWVLQELWFWVLLAAVLLGLSGCCNHDLAMPVIEDSISANRGHEGDDNLPSESRAIGRVNADTLEQVRYLLDGTPLSAEAAARRDARAEAE